MHIEYLSHWSRLTSIKVRKKIKMHHYLDYMKYLRWYVFKKNQNVVLKLYIQAIHRIDMNYFKKEQFEYHNSKN